MTAFTYVPTYSDLMPLGSIVESFVDLNWLSNGKWIALFGQTVPRGSLDPRLASRFHGQFTPTARTLGSTPNAAAGAADTTNFLVVGTSSGTVQASADGITWSTTATWAGANVPCSLILAGSRYIMAGNGGDLAVPYVSTSGQTAANQIVKSNWTATTGGNPTTLTQSLAYSPSLGRTVLILHGATTAVYTLEDGATAWTSRTTSTSLARTAVVWSGKYFITVCAASPAWQYSADGITWTDVARTLDNAASSSYASMVSDGAGTVIIGSRNSRSFTVSKDGGDTWNIVPVNLDYGQTLSVGQVSYANGLFLAGPDSVTYGYGVSVDGISWNTDWDLQSKLATAWTAANTMWLFKNGVYLAFRTTTAAFTFTENRSVVTLPTTVNSSTLTTATTPQGRYYMKVLN